MHCSPCRPPSVVAALSLLIYTPKQREHNPGAVPAVGNAKEEENARMRVCSKTEQKRSREGISTNEANAMFCFYVD